MKLAFAKEIGVDYEWRIFVFQSLFFFFFSFTKNGFLSSADKVSLYLLYLNINTHK